MSEGAAIEPVSVTIRELTVRFGAQIAVDRVSLSIAPGELFLLLGPSGCGKTTLLRALAGFAAPEPGAGTIHFGDQDVTPLPAHARNAGMVFQSFALWPHLSVFENVAFGLRARKVKVSKGEIQSRVEAALASTRMAGKGPRRIDELSGGEQQRVALARALVTGFCACAEHIRKPRAQGTTSRRRPFPRAAADARAARGPRVPVPAPPDSFRNARPLGL